MANIAEHNTEQEREGNDGKHCWINFFVHRNTIGIYDFLEDIGEIVGFNVRWWLDGVIFESVNLSGGECAEFLL